MTAPYSANTSTAPLEQRALVLAQRLRELKAALADMEVEPVERLLLAVLQAALSSTSLNGNKQ